MIRIDREECNMREDVKGTRWMPWHRKPTKDAISCDKLRRGANTRYQPQVSEWGNPRGAMPARPRLNP